MWPQSLCFQSSLFLPAELLSLALEYSQFKRLFHSSAFAKQKPSVLPPKGSFGTPHAQNLIAAKACYRASMVPLFSLLLAPAEFLSSAL